MQIVIIGCGNVGSTLAAKLSNEGHNISVIDTNRASVEAITTANDVMGIVGNGASLNVLLEAGMKEADLLIAVTGSDELNLLCCLIAKKAGNCHTIVRVSNPLYSREAAFIRDELGLSLIVNPQQSAAIEMASILRFPSALHVGTFSKSRMELVVIRLDAGNPLCGMSLSQMSARYRSEVLVTVVERDDKVYIPDGSFVLEKGDEISIVANRSTMVEFFKKLGLPTAAVKSAIIAGSGLTGSYLIRELLEMGVRVKVIEQNIKVCEELSENFPKAMVIHGDCTDRNLLNEEGVQNTGAFVSLTNIDEENLMLALYVKSLSKAKLITKVHRVSYDKLIENLDIGSVIYPKYIAAENIIKYVRAMQRTHESNIETLYLMNDDQVEAMEFLIEEDSAVIGVPLKDLPLKKGIIIASISRDGKGIIPHGEDVIQAGDTIILITMIRGITDIEDVLA